MSNLQSRFEQKELIACMDVLVPDNIVKAEELSKFENEEMKTLSTHFSQQVTADIDACVTEYKQYKRIVRGNYEKLSLMKCYMF